MDTFRRRKKIAVSLLALVSPISVDIRTCACAPHSHNTHNTLENAHYTDYMQPHITSSHYGSTLVLSITLLLLLACSIASALKNDRGESSFGNGPNFPRRNRRLTLNEYLVPPPLPRHHPLRSGRMSNPQPTDAPGYFSKLINLFNPFGFGNSHSNAPPYPDAPLPPPPPPQTHLPFNVHPPVPPNPPLHPSLEPQPPLPLYPPLGQPPDQHSGLINPPLPLPPGPPLNAPHSPSLPIYGPPPPTLHSAKQHLSSPNKGRACNPCNKVPWVPMQEGGFHSSNQYLPPPLPNGYLPPNNQGNYDTQHAASHEVRVPNFPNVQSGHSGPPGLVDPLPNPTLYPGPVPPLYKPESFEQPPQNFHTDVVGHLEPPVLPNVSGEHNHPDVTGDHFNAPGNHDLTSSGTQVDQGHVSVVPQNHGTGFNREPVDHGGSFGSSIFDSQPPISGFGSSSVENQGFSGHNGDVYQESFASNSGHGNDLNYLPPNLSPSPSYGSSTSNNREVESLNYQYSGDLSPSSSIVKDSHATSETPLASSPSIKENSVHFEESPLLDLTDKSRTGPVSTFGSDVDSTIRTTTNSNLLAGNVVFGDSSFAKPTESHAVGPSTPASMYFSGNSNNRYTETSTAGTQYTNPQDVSYIPPSGQPGFLWPSLLLNTPPAKNNSANGDAFLDPLARWSNSSNVAKNYEQQGRPDSTDASDTTQRQNVKRNKQVQVIIPYTSEYTPIPFQQSYGDWSVKNNHDRTQARKVPSASNQNIDNYLQQESRNEIRLINHLQFTFNDSKKLNIQSAKPSLAAAENNSRSTPNKTNTSIDVRRLQKNIDNWTIQEYSKPTTSSTVIPSSPHPYLQPSKKIPTEYLTTTEHGDHANESNDNIESVKTYSLAGFSFNEVDHEGSASNRIEATETPIKVIRIESSKSTSSSSGSANKLNEKSTWEEYSVTISPVDKERVYVVTPQTIPSTTPKNNFEKQKKEGDKSSAKNEQQDDDDFSQFEAIEKAYQVLPQAVNNLAVASTGKEDVPLWGIMEHEEFAALNADESDDEANEDSADGPILYSGHSKVSRAKR
ncbi:uncharacterized protein LOC143180049 [Calliopsis andreniformis]|uniref:uncharacterized protein LOC143180049 n=1 Tax=Calliopsis andreniformis TaxID=337506 RepID=UPI003FCC8B47